MQSALVELALESPSRTLSYEAIAAHLAVDTASIELIVLEALEAGAIQGCIDAESAHVVISGTRLPQPEQDKVRHAAAGLDQLEAQLAAEVSTRKRNHNVLDDQADSPN